MFVSVIISTHNNHRALTLVLHALTHQVYTNFEVVIAEDGECTQTREVIEHYKSTKKFPIKHVSQQYEGFNKCKILNAAAQEAEGEYFIFLDGDCMVRSTHIQQHIKHADYFRYIVGGKVLLNPSASGQFTVEKLDRGYLEKPGRWWLSAARKQRLFFSLIPGVRSFLDNQHPYAPSWRGENASVYAENFFKINGFDENFSYGFEDKDFGRRLHKQGLESRSIRYREPVFHLYHEKPYWNSGMHHENRKLFLEKHGVR